MAKKTTKRILIAGLVILSPFLLLFAIVFLPQATRQPPPLRGEVVLPTERPKFKPTFSETPYPKQKFDWLHNGVNNFMTWDKNPWKVRTSIFGEHYMTILGSEDPADQAKVAELKQWGDALYQRVLERYPELAVEYKDIPPEENGFLKWLEFCERQKNSSGQLFDIPKSLQKQLNGRAPWDEEVARQWLSENRNLLDELRAIGSMPEQSTKDIDVNRRDFSSISQASSAVGVLMLDARLSIAEGHPSKALESVQAARGLADHFSEIETPTLISTAIANQAQKRVTDYTLRELIPSLPANEFKPSQWENALNPQLQPPSTLGEAFAGEWHVASRRYTFPMLSDSEDPYYPSDPAALIDYQAASHLQLKQTYHSEELTDWQTTPRPPHLDPTHLSRNSRRFSEEFNFAASPTWPRIFQQSNNRNGLTQAAFAIMRGEAAPNDPIYNQPYQWDPTTRELSLPNTPEFENHKAITVTVPQVP